MSVLGLHQVALAVDDLPASTAFWTAVFGLRAHGEADVPTDGIREVMLSTGAGSIQLISPTAPDSTVRRFLDRRGQGLHHLGLQVSDIDAAVHRAAEHGVHVLGAGVRDTPSGDRVAFLHPKALGGVLVELIEEPTR